jgi:prepilin-type N-terminal cleavage/methylation domain-containing protein
MLRGFTLIEMIVAIGIFAVMMTVIAATFASGAFAFRGSRDLQRNVESAQYAMNTMAKHLRTSTVVYPTSPDNLASQIRFYDYSSSRCFEYRIQDDTLQARWSAGTDPEDSTVSLDDCRSSGVSGTFSDMTPSVVEGGFSVVPSDDGATGGDRQIGRVTISLSVRNDAGSGSATSAGIQTSVSLRDYAFVGY